MVGWDVAFCAADSKIQLSYEFIAVIPELQYWVLLPFHLTDWGTSQDRDQRTS